MIYIIESLYSVYSISWNDQTFNEPYFFFFNLILNYLIFIYICTFIYICGAWVVCIDCVFFTVCLGDRQLPDSEMFAVCDKKCLGLKNV